jgi:hypothetical protein
VGFVAACLAAPDLRSSAACLHVIVGAMLLLFAYRMIVGRAKSA